MPTFRTFPATWSPHPPPGSTPISRFRTLSFSWTGWPPKWAADLKRDQATVRKEIEQIVQENAAAPWFGLAGEKFVNVLEINLSLRTRYGAP